MDRDLRDLWKLLAALAALIGVVGTVVLLLVKYHDAIGDFFTDLRMKCPCHRDEDDYADDELNSICDIDMFSD